MTLFREVTSGKMQNNKPLPYNFNIYNLLKEAWTDTLDSVAISWGAICFYLFTYFLLVVVLYGFAGFLCYICGETFHTSGSFIDIVISPSFIYSMISIICNIASLALLPLYTGIFYLGLLIVSNQPKQVENIFLPFKKSFKIFAVFILTYLLIFILGVFIYCFGSFVLHTINTLITIKMHQWITEFISVSMMIMIFVCATYLYFGFNFAYLLVFEKNMGIYAAMKASLLGFSQHWFKIIMVNIILIIIVAISAIPFFIGFIWTIPMSINCFGVLYRTIFGIEQHSSTSSTH